MWSIQWKVIWQAELRAFEADLSHRARSSLFVGKYGAFVIHTWEMNMAVLTFSPINQHTQTEHWHLINLLLPREPQLKVHLLWRAYFTCAISAVFNKRCIFLHHKKWYCFFWTKSNAWFFIFRKVMSLLVQDVDPVLKLPRHKYMHNKK